MKFNTFIVAMLALAYASVVSAGISPEEAQKLGTTLTLVGAEKAGNKDGTIPEYTGGLTTPPPGFKKGDGKRPDPFAHEKPLFSINAKNMEQYADKLSEGVKGMMKAYPTFRIDVYPTHRTVAYPKFVLDNTVKNATRAKTTLGGVSIEGAHAGYPFPIPKDGYEVMWNHLVRYQGKTFRYRYDAYNVDSSGRVTLGATANNTMEAPYYQEEKTSDPLFFRLKADFVAPARRAGEGALFYEPLDYGKTGRRTWLYLPGQRRVKLAPDYAYDAPSPSTGGTSTIDDSFLFNGGLDRFNFKLVGKKEIFVPYNTNRFTYYATKDEVFKTPHHINPEIVRWELHRVWVVDATLKEGKRHVYSRRTFYLDEDSWTILASDEYDARGQLWRVGLAYLVQNADGPAPWSDLYSTYDLISRNHSLTSRIADHYGLVFTTDPLPENEWSPDALAGSGIR